MAELSRRPYLLRAMLDWMVDCGHTPHLIVDAAPEGVRVPKAYVKEGRIVLNISPNATQSLQIDGEAVSFNARFGGVAQVIHVPIDAVLGIYARETGQGMSFPAVSVGAGVPTDTGQVGLLSVADASTEGRDKLRGKDRNQPRDPQPPRPNSGGRPSLKRVK